MNLNNIQVWYKNSIEKLITGKRKIKVFSIAEDYSLIQQTKLSAYRKISYKNPAKESIKLFYESLKKERKLIDKNLRKFILNIDINFLEELLGKNSTEFLKLKKLIIDIDENLEKILIQYDRTILNFEQKFINIDFLKNLDNNQEKEFKKIREDIRIETQSLKIKINNIFEYNLQKEVNDITSYFTSKKFAENRLEKIVEISNSFSKEFKTGLKEVSVPVLYTNISMMVVRYLTEEMGLVKEISEFTDFEKDTVGVMISWIVVLISFYGTAFVRTYYNNLTKYKGNINLLINDYLKIYTSIFVLGYGIGGTSFAGLDKFFQAEGNVRLKPSFNFKNFKFQYL